MLSHENFPRDSYRTRTTWPRPFLFLPWFLLLTVILLLKGWVCCYCSLLWAGSPRHSTGELSDIHTFRHLPHFPLLGAPCNIHRGPRRARRRAGGCHRVPVCRFPAGSPVADILSGGNLGPRPSVVIRECVGAAKNPIFTISRAAATLQTISTLMATRVGLSITVDPHRDDGGNQKLAVLGLHEP